MAEFKIGDKVRIKDRTDWPSPPGYRLANAEGVVAKWNDLEEVMADFQDFIYVRLDKDKDKANIGKTLFCSNSKSKYTFYLFCFSKKLLYSCFFILLCLFFIQEYFF